MTNVEATQENAKKSNYFTKLTLRNKGKPRDVVLEYIFFMLYLLLLINQFLIFLIEN